MLAHIHWFSSHVLVYAWIESRIRTLTNAAPQSNVCQCQLTFCDAIRHPAYVERTMNKIFINECEWMTKRFALCERLYIAFDAVSSERPNANHFSNTRSTNFAVTIVAKWCLLSQERKILLCIMCLCNAYRCRHTPRMERINRQT